MHQHAPQLAIPPCRTHTCQAWFETDESADPLPWVEVRLPHNVTMVKMSRYSFAHGHRRSGYFRMRNWRTQVAPMLSASPKFSELNTRCVGRAGVALPGPSTRWAQGQQGSYGIGGDARACLQ